AHHPAHHVVAHHATPHHTAAHHTAVGLSLFGPWLSLAGLGSLLGFAGPPHSGECERSKRKADYQSMSTHVQASWSPLDVETPSSDLSIRRPMHDANERRYCAT